MTECDVTEIVPTVTSVRARAPPRAGAKTRAQASGGRRARHRGVRQRVSGSDGGMITLALVGEVVPRAQTTQSKEKEKEKMPRMRIERMASRL